MMQETSAPIGWWSSAVFCKAFYSGIFAKPLAGMVICGSDPNRTAPGLLEAVWFKLRGHGDVVQHGIVSLFGFGRWDVSDGLQQSPMVEPVDPFERGKLDGFERS